jgi:succinate dehydrogenase / fumarate reductase membrane anchor subunit
MGTGTGLGRVRGLGSAKQGAHHWWQQRLTAAANVLLISWFFLSLLRLPNLTYPVITDWLSTPLVAIAMILLTANVFWHLRLGLQVVIEDYIENEATKLAVILLINFYAAGGAAVAIFSIAKIAFGGAA